MKQKFTIDLSENEASLLCEILSQAAFQDYDSPADQEVIFAVYRKLERLIEDYERQ